MEHKRRFFKMHVCGNDFMVINATSDALELSADNIQQWSDRRKGIGFDQLLVLESPLTHEHDFRMLIFNGDGRSARQCGNGCAAVAALVKGLGLITNDVVVLDTLGGSVVCKLADVGGTQATVELPPPVLNPVDVPFLTDATGHQHKIEIQSPVNRCIEATVLSMGNPHAVVRVDDVETTDLDGLGRALQQHKQFPDSVNVEILHCKDRNRGKLRIFERGVGETQSCGSGACASMVAGRLWNCFDSRVEIEMPGGCVRVEWEGPAQPVRLSCNPCRTYDGFLMHM